MESDSYFEFREVRKGAEGLVESYQRALVESFIIADTETSTPSKKCLVGRFELQVLSYKKMWNIVG